MPSRVSIDVVGDDYAHGISACSVPAPAVEPAAERADAVGDVGHRGGARRRRRRSTVDNEPVAVPTVPTAA